MDRDAKQFEKYYKDNPFGIHRGYGEYNGPLLDAIEDEGKSDTKPTKKKKSANPASSTTTQSSEETM